MISNDKLSHLLHFRFFFFISGRNITRENTQEGSLAAIIIKNLGRFAKMARPGTSEWGQIKDSEQGRRVEKGGRSSLFLSFCFSVSLSLLSLSLFLSMRRLGRKGRRTYIELSARAARGRGMAVRVEREKREGRPWCCWPDDRCNLASRRPASRSNDPVHRSKVFES